MDLEDGKKWTLHECFEALVLDKMLDEEVGEDAKLSPEKRKELPAKVFCGPGKSFPVNDCAHYTAALRLLNRAKVSNKVKERIRACVLRKGKSLNCPGANEEK